MTDLGPLGPLDELLAHQIVDTFATVSQSDRSWTEKICAMAGARRRLDLARLRARQVPEPRRDGCVRRRVARHRAVDGARQPRARRRRRHRHGRADALRSARADAPHPVRARSPTTRSPSRSSGSSRASCPRCSRTTRCTAPATDGASTPTSRATTTSAPRTVGSSVDGERTEFTDEHLGVDP